MAFATFTPDEEGVHKILNEAEAKQYMGSATEVISAAVLQMVPVDSGGYLKAFTRTLVRAVEMDEELGAVGLVGTTFGLYGIIEFGSAKNVAYHPFGRAVQALGLQWVPAGGP